MWAPPPATASPTRLATPSYTPTLRPSPVTADKYARPTRSPSHPASAGFNASAFGGGHLVASDDSSPVHIVYVLGDDIGYNDLGYQSSDFGPNSLPLGGVTPKLDELATSGIILDRFHAMPQCTPSRSSLLSGVHPMHTGMFVTSISPNTPFGLPLHFRLLPEYLKMANSATCTHGIGKWDIGHYHWRYLPVHRGFDSWYGYYSAFTSYLSHIGNYGLCTNGIDCFTDFNDNGRSLKHEAGKYSTRLFAEQAEKIIEEHDPAAPLFLYFAPTNCHANVAVPVELMEEHSSTISGVPEHARRIYASCMMSLDGAVQRIEANLKSNDLWNRTLFIFTSDNGAPDANAPQNGEGSNWPLRGGKFTPYEGGTRVPGFVHSPLLPAARRGIKFTGLFHLIDWTRTFVEGIYGAAGTAVLDGDVSHQDSFNQMGALLGTSAAARRMIIHNIDDCNANTANLIDPTCVLVWFCVDHPPFPMPSTPPPRDMRRARYGETTLSYLTIHFPERHVCARHRRRVTSGAITIDDWKLVIQGSNDTRWPVPLTNFPPMGEEKFVAYNDYGGSSGWISAQLFNITADPLEKHDLKFVEPAVVDRLNVTFQRLVSIMATGISCGPQTGPGADSAVKVWRAHNETIGPYIQDPLYMYHCSEDYCTMSPSAAPSFSPFPSLPNPTAAAPSYAPTAAQPNPTSIPDPAFSSTVAPTAAQPNPTVVPDPAFSSQPAMFPTRVPSTVPAPTVSPTVHEFPLPVPAPTAEQLTLEQSPHPVPAPTAGESPHPVPAPTAGESSHPVPAPTAGESPHPVAAPTTEQSPPSRLRVRL